MSKHLDDMVREFREYAEGKNGYDELDIKEDLWNWHREECLKLIPEQKYWSEFVEPYNQTTNPDASWQKPAREIYMEGYNQAIDDMDD